MFYSIFRIRVKDSNSSFPYALYIIMTNDLF